MMQNLPKSKMAPGSKREKKFLPTSEQPPLKDDSSLSVQLFIIKFTVIDYLIIPAPDEVLKSTFNICK